MKYVTNKYDVILGRELENRERVDRSHSQIAMMHRNLTKISSTLDSISDSLDEDTLVDYARAIDMAMKAVENARFFGSSTYVPQELETVEWEGRIDL